VGIVPHVKVAARDAGRFVEFAVSDNGPGIAPEYHDRIFYHLSDARRPG
jgi:signal transduction histidine kinase